MLDNNQNDDLIDALNAIKHKETEQEENEELDSFLEPEEESLYPPSLADTTLERAFIGLLLNEIKAISVYNFLYDDCYFADESLLNIYKKILFTDGEKYAPVRAKEGFNFAKESNELYNLKNEIKAEYATSNLQIDDVYNRLKKLFIIRKGYLEIPVKEIQPKIAEILNYELYDKMTPEDVANTVEQVTATEKFKRAILNNSLTEFLVNGDNTLTNGLYIPFPILSSVFKGI